MKPSRKGALAIIVLVAGVACGRDEPSGPAVVVVGSPDETPRGEVASGGETVVPPPAEEPSPCALVVEDVEVTTAGVEFVVQVDSRSMQRAHLVANARRGVPESSTSFELLLEENGATIGQSDEVCVGASSPECFASLELDPGIGLRTFVLTAKAKTSPTVAGRIEVCVFDPLE